MIYIIDDFIDKDLFRIATDYLKKGEFIKKTVGEKNFYIQLCFKQVVYCRREALAKHIKFL